MIRIIINIALLMLGALVAGWTMARLIEGGLSFSQTGFCIAGAWLALSAVLLAIANIARAEL